MKIAITFPSVFVFLNLQKISFLKVTPCQSSHFMLKKPTEYQWEEQNYQPHVSDEKQRPPREVTLSRSCR